MVGARKASKEELRQQNQQHQQHPKGNMMNGFATLPEPNPLKIAEENLAPFTMPVEAFTFIPAPDVVTCHFKNGDKERKIYCNIDLTSTEIQQLRRLQEDARRQNLSFLPSITVMASRFLSRARGDPAKAIQLMLKTQEWRQQYFRTGSVDRPVVDSDVREDLKHGIVYFAGRDKALRPSMILRPIRVPALWYKEKCIDRLIRILIFCMEYMLRYMIVPGKVENNNVIVDLTGLTIAQVPLSALGEIYSVMSHHYIGRVYKFYICNMGTGLSAIAGMAKRILTDRQKQKLVILDNVRELRKEFALHHLEEDLGGTRPVIKEFFPFPLLAGPFEVGSDGAPSADAVPGAHALLTPEGARGRLWDSGRSREENLELDFVPEAFEFFKKHDLPIPPECLKQQELRNKKISVCDDATPTVASDGSRVDQSPDNLKPDAFPTEDRNAGFSLRTLERDDMGEEDLQKDEGDFIVQDTAIKPKEGLFGCKPCFCNEGGKGR